MSDPAQPPDSGERLELVRTRALALVEALRALATTEPADRQASWDEYLGLVQDLAHAAKVGAVPRTARNLAPKLTLRQRQELGTLLRDKRDAAGLSRVQLARKAKLSDATIKFLETAHHPPSRATLIRLVGIEALKLSWADIPGQLEPPPSPHPPPDSLT